MKSCILNPFWQAWILRRRWRSVEILSEAVGGGGGGIVVMAFSAVKISASVFNILPPKRKPCGIWSFAQHCRREVRIFASELSSGGFHSQQRKLFVLGIEPGVAVLVFECPY